MLGIYRVVKWRGKYLSLLSTLRYIDNKPKNGQIFIQRSILAVLTRRPFDVVPLSLVIFFNF